MEINPEILAQNLEKLQQIKLNLEEGLKLERREALLTVSNGRKYRMWRDGKIYSLCNIEDVDLMYPEPLEPISNASANAIPVSRS